MIYDSGIQNQGPSVMGESGNNPASPPTPVEGPVVGIPEGSDSPVSIFDILYEMVVDEDPNTDALRKILSKDGSIVGNKNPDGSMALHVAATKGLLKAVEILLEFHASVSAQDDWGRQPLYLACSHGNTDIAKLLLAQGAAIDARRDGHTSLDAACWSGQVAIVEVLIEKGAKVSVADNNGCSPLFIASALGYEKIAKLLLGKDKSNINQNEKVYGRTALHVVMLLGYVSIASMLIDEGAEVNLQDSEGHTALHVAIFRRFPRLVTLFLDGGSKIDIQDHHGWTALHFVARFSDKEIATKVLSIGVQDIVNVQDKHGRTALHIASRHSNESVVKALLEEEDIRSKLEMNVKDNDDNTALHLAAGASDGDVDQYDPDDGSESSSEEKAIRQGAITEELLGAGADSKIKNKQSKTIIDLIMADDEPYRFRGLLAYVSHPYLSPESTPNDLDTKKKEVNSVLTREEFFTLLTKLVHKSSPGIAIDTTLRSTLYMILDVLRDGDSIPLLKHFPSALRLLIAASSPNDYLNTILKSAAESIGNILKQRRRAQRSKEKPQMAPQTNIAIFNSESKEIVQDKRKEVVNAGCDIPEENLNRKVLGDIRDILRDPQFSQLHRDDYSTFIRPQAGKWLEGVLERFEAVIVQFYKERGESGSLLRYRSVNEVIYGAGPTTIMKARYHCADFKFKQEPRLSWVHLPSTNVSI